mmetsp:Transcript_113971/g.333075  ORF Transcript_113971/g.333075 Transcript_113971/m.333075 type:complete len:272 (-) Transcript_113971:168-983(-)
MQQPQQPPESLHNGLLAAAWRRGQPSSVKRCSADLCIRGRPGAGLPSRGRTPHATAWQCGASAGTTSLSQAQKSTSSLGHGSGGRAWCLRQCPFASPWPTIAPTGAALLGSSTGTSHPTRWQWHSRSRQCSPQRHVASTHPSAAARSAGRSRGRACRPAPRAGSAAARRCSWTSAPAAPPAPRAPPPLKHKATEIQLCASMYRLDRCRGSYLPQVRHLTRQSPLLVECLLLVSLGPPSSLCRPILLRPRRRLCRLLSSPPRQCSLTPWWES